MKEHCGPVDLHAEFVLSRNDCAQRIQLRSLAQRAQPRPSNPPRAGTTANTGATEPLYDCKTVLVSRYGEHRWSGVSAGHLSSQQDLELKYLVEERSAAHWCDERRPCFNGLIIKAILALKKSFVREMRTCGQLFVKTSDVLNMQMNDVTVLFAFARSPDAQRCRFIDEHERLMTFEYVVGEYRPLDWLSCMYPDRHPANTRFDAEPVECIRALLIQHVIKMDPIVVLEAKRKRSV
jgi:hypothetical protein